MILRLAFLPLLAAVVACQPSQSVALERSAEGLEQVPLTIKSHGKRHAFVVEVARTLEEQQQGLMNRQTLAPGRGMIFPYDPPQPVAFWMKNTLIPLDMIFIRADGTIDKIVADAVPYSEDRIYSEGPVTAVLEINAGRCAALGIAVGDKVTWEGRGR